MQAERRDLVPLCGIIDRWGKTALALSVAWHVVLVAVTLAVSHWLVREQPELVVQEIVFVQERSDPAASSSTLSVPTPTPTPPSPAPSPPVQPIPTAPVAASKAVQPVPASKVVSVHPHPAPKPRSLAIEPISQAVPTADGVERGRASSSPVSPSPAVVPTSASVPATAPGYHMGSVSTPSPDYPYSARRRRREGVVLIGLDVSADGDVTLALVLESSGDAALDEAARNTLERWRLRPATEGGHPVAGRVEVPVRFRLQ